jgi:hypothetical protein
MYLIVDRFDSAHHQPGCVPRRRNANRSGRNAAQLVRRIVNNKRRDAGSVRPLRLCFCCSVTDTVDGAQAIASRAKRLRALKAAIMGQGLIADRVAYSRRLVQAGINGLRFGEQRLNCSESAAHMAHSVRGAFKAAAIGAGLGLLGCVMARRREGRLPRVIACGALAFCAEFAWQTRDVSSQLVGDAAREISRVRDERWLELNPIDYA